MPESPSPTPSQTSSNAVAIGGRSSVALNEALRRLRRDVPLQITHENQRLNLVGNQSYQQFDGFGLAPTDQTKVHINRLLVSLNFGFMPQGSRAHKRRGTLKVFIIEQVWAIDQQITNGLDRSEIVMMVLQNFMTGCRDPQGRWCWRELTPRRQTDLSGHYPKYSGVCLEYDILQNSGDNLWAV